MWKIRYDILWVNPKAWKLNLKLNSRVMYTWHSDNTIGKAQHPRKQLETFQMYSQEHREEENGRAMLGQQLPSSEGQWQMVADSPNSMPEQTGWKLPRPTGFTSASPTSQSEARLDKYFPFQSQNPAWHTLRPSMSHNQERYLLILISKYRSRLDYISLDITVPLVPTLTTTCHLTMSVRPRQPPTVAASLQR